MIDDETTQADGATDEVGTLTMFGDDNDFHTTWQEWKGMPEFSQADLKPWGEIVVKFASPQDFDAFRKLIEQPELRLPMTRGCWYPKLIITHFVDKRYRDESTPVPDDVPGRSRL